MGIPWVVGNSVEVSSSAPPTPQAARSKSIDVARARHEREILFFISCQKSGCTSSGCRPSETGVEFIGSTPCIAGAELVPAGAGTSSERFCELRWGARYLQLGPEISPLNGGRCASHLATPAHQRAPRSMNPRDHSCRRKHATVTIRFHGRFLRISSSKRSKSLTLSSCRIDFNFASSHLISMPIPFYIG